MKIWVFIHILFNSIMNNIVLSNDGNNLITLELYEMSIMLDSNDINFLPKEPVYVDTDKEYDVFLKIDEPINKDTIFKFAINGSEVDCELVDLSTDRVCIQTSSKKIFYDFFGYIYITVQLNNKLYTTNYIDTLTTDTFYTHQIEPMLSYVENNCEFILQIERMTAYKASLGHNGILGKYKNIVELYRAILNIYRMQFKYFQVDTRYKISNIEMVDDYYKVQKFSRKTFKHIISNPNNMLKSNNNIGIKYNNTYYIPQKIVSEKMQIDYNIKENVIILSFASKILKDINKRIMHNKGIIKNLSNNSLFYSKGLITAPKYILSGQKQDIRICKLLEKESSDLQQLKTEFCKLYFDYKNILKCNEVKLGNSIPNSKIFTEVNHYKMIYRCIKDYFNNNYKITSSKYDLLISICRNSKLYEYYVLCKIFNFINTTSSFKYISGEKIEELQENNIFTFDTNEIQYIFEFDNQNDKTIRFYYQPKIYEFNDNIVKLRRVNKTKNNRKGNYKPDYIIEKYDSKSNKFQYVILDAKFSGYSTIYKYTLSEIAFKYIVGLEPTKDNATVEKVVILNGKYYNKDKLEYYSKYRNETINAGNNFRKMPSFILSPLFAAHIYNMDKEYVDIDDFNNLSEYLTL